MKRRATIFDVAEYFGLRVEVVFDVPPDFAGCLIPSDATTLILINGNRPAHEQRFTIAHEIAHYVLHPSRRPRTPSRWVIRNPWNSHFAKVWSRAMRRWIHRTFTLEKEADLWAMSLLIRLGDTDALKDYIGSNPKRIGWLWLLGLSNTFRRLVRMT